MADKKIIAVVGATGAQGGGLVRAICGPERRLRRAGHHAGREIRQGEGARQARRRGGRRRRRRPGEPEEGVRRRARAYCVTFFWAHFSPEKEKAEAAHGAGGEGRRRQARRSGPRSRTRASGCRSRTTGCRRCMGKYKVPHFDAKGEPTACSRTSACRRRSCYTSFYWDNFIYFGMGPKKGPGRKAGDRPADGRQEAAGHRRRGHRQVRVRDLQGRERVHRQDASASPAST